MHRPHRVQVFCTRCALEKRSAQLCLHDEEVQRIGNGCIGQLTPQHGLHWLQTCQVRDLVIAGYTRARTFQQATVAPVFFGNPQFQA